MRISYMIGGLVAALALAFSASATLAQTTTTNPAPTPCAGNACPGTSQMTAVAGSAFQGTFGGGFGQLVDGKFVAGNGVTGEVKGTQEGGGNTFVDLKYSGAACGLSCGASKLDAKASAYQNGSVSAKAMGTVPGVTFGGATAGSLTAAGTLAVSHTGTIGSNPPSP